MKLLTIGASGYIGRPLHARAMTGFGGYGTSSLGAVELLPLQLDDPADFDYGLILPGDVVFLTAAISAPDICAREHEHARAWVNVTGTSKLFTHRG